MEPVKHDFSTLWAVHSEKDHRPVFRAWAASEGEAQRKLAELRAADGGGAGTDYWVVQMTRHEVAHLQQAGLLPADA